MKYQDFYNNLIFEAFDSVNDLLSNPAYDDSKWNAVLNQFMLNGGKVVGQGKHAIVLQHPSWNYIVKVFSDDVPYLKFVRFCIQNPRISFPVFYDKPRRIVPHYVRRTSQQYLYVVKMEKLDHISHDTFNDIYAYVKYHDPLRADRIESEHPHIVQFKKDFMFLMENALKLNFGEQDLHEYNIMKRSNGVFVLTDPFFSMPNKSNELDNFERELKGGEIAKRRLPKPATYPQPKEPQVEPYGDAAPAID